MMWLIFFIYIAPIFLETLFAGTVMLGFIRKVEIYNVPMDVRLLTSFQVVCVSSPAGRDLRPRAHQGNWQPQRNCDFRELLSAWVEHLLLTGAAQIVETATQFPQFALLHAVTCVQLTDNNSRESRLRCSCQFPWFALALKQV
jgi:hypothetical protein